MKMVRKIMITIAILLGIALVCVFVIAMVFGKVNRGEQVNQEEILASESGDRRALILYQDSKGKTVRENVEQLAACLHEEGFEITMNHPRQDLTYKASDYEVVALVSPVYMGQVSQPLCAYADGQDFSDTKVFILVTGKIQDKNEAEIIQTHVKNAKAVSGLKVGKTEDKTIEMLRELIAQ